MAGRNLIDERIKARKLYVEDGITNFTELAALVDVDRGTVAQWASKEKWKSQRTSQVTSIDNITNRMLGVLEKYLVQIEEMQANGEPLSPKTVGQLKNMAESIAKLKKDFDERGGVIAMWKKLIAYIVTLKGERELLKGLQRIAAGFFAYIEK
jgi:hypothetical protein